MSVDNIASRKSLGDVAVALWHKMTVCVFVCVCTCVPFFFFFFFLTFGSNKSTNKCYIRRNPES